MRSEKNREASYEVVEYGSGVWAGKWVVRRIVAEDVAATLTRADAEALMRLLEKDQAQ